MPLPILLVRCAAEPNMIRGKAETRARYRLASPAAWFMEARMVKPSPLDDRDTSDIAWARYRRLMKGMALVSLLSVVGALGWLRFTMGEALTIHMIIATAAGVGLSSGVIKPFDVCVIVRKHRRLRVAGAVSLIANL